jgi:hypothetical protein
VSGISGRRDDDLLSMDTNVDYDFDLRHLTCNDLDDLDSLSKTIAGDIEIEGACGKFHCLESTLFVYREPPAEFEDCDDGVEGRLAVSTDDTADHAACLLSDRRGSDKRE